MSKIPRVETDDILVDSLSVGIPLLTRVELGKKEAQENIFRGSGDSPFQDRLGLFFILRGHVKSCVE